jgi:hypothetical protein
MDLGRPQLHCGPRMKFYIVEAMWICSAATNPFLPATSIERQNGRIGYLATKERISCLDLGDDDASIYGRPLGRGSMT